MPKKLAICFVENLSTGNLHMARFTSKEIGPEVWRQRAFYSAQELIDLPDQDLFDLAKTLQVEVKSKEETARQLWVMGELTQTVYARTREQTEEFLDMTKAKLERTGGRKRAAKKKTVEDGKRGRPSDFAGKKLYVKTAENPRREGSHGAASFALIKNGMTIDEFVAAGGRMADLRWDVAKGHVEAR